MLLKNPCCFAGSSVNPIALLDGLLYGFMGTYAMNLTVMQILFTSFEKTTTYNVLDKDAKSIWVGFDTLPADQTFYAYIKMLENPTPPASMPLLMVCYRCTGTWPWPLNRTLTALV